MAKQSETQVILNMLDAEVIFAMQEYRKLPGLGRRSLAGMQRDLCWFLQQHWCIEHTVGQERPKAE